MRITSYFVTFALVAILLTLNSITTRRPDWLVVRYSEVLNRVKVTVTYGLYQRCELVVSEFPGGDGKISYRKYECRPFPASVKDSCEKENKAFCAAWTSAGYIHQLGLGFGIISLGAILFGVSTHSRRRRIWTAVAGLVFLQAVCEIATFVIITDTYKEDSYPSFNRARPGLAYIVHTVSWIFGILVTLGIILTGISANAGHRWAAGNRAYQPISGP